MKRIVLTTIAAAIALQTQATVLLNDTFADASRAELNLPTESPAWAGTPASVVMNPGSLRYNQSGSSQKLWTYFAADGAPVSLGVGQQLTTTIDFTARTALYDNSAKSFRFGLFNDPTNPQVAADVNSDGGGTGSPWTDSKGYGVNFALSTGATKSATPSVGKRTDMANTSLMGSGGAWTMTAGGSPIVNTIDTLYTLTFSLNRLAVDQMGVTFSIADAGGVISTHSITDDPNGTAALGTAAIATNFDQLFFRFSKNTETADAIEFSRIKIEVVPEPTVTALMGVGIMAIVGARRSRR
jgi:hypothetical protein